MAARGSGNVTARAQRRGRPFSSPRSPRHGECCAQASASMKAVSASMKAVSASMITSDGARKPRSIHILPFPLLSARFRLEQQGAYLPYTGISRVIKDRHPSRQGSPFRPLRSGLKDRCPQRRRRAAAHGPGASGLAPGGTGPAAAAGESVTTKMLKDFGAIHGLRREEAEGWRLLVCHFAQWKVYCLPADSKPVRCRAGQTMQKGV